MKSEISHHAWHRRDGQRIANLILVAALAAVLIVMVVLPKSKADLDFFYLILLLDVIFALWAAWYMPTERLIGLIVMGALIGAATEYSARYAGLWDYQSDVSIIAGLFLYALTAVAIFVLVYMINRVLDNFCWAKTTGWLNCFFMLMLFLVFFTLLYHDQDQAYIKLLRVQPWVMAYYVLLFISGVVLAYLMRLGTLLSIIFAAAGVSLVGQYAGGTHAGIWTWLPWQHLPKSPFPPKYLIFGLWPLEYITEFGWSAGIAGILTTLFQVRSRQAIEDGKKPEKPSADLYYPKSPTESPGYIDPKDSIKISICPWDRKRESFLAGFSNYTRRVQLKMMRDSLERGQVVAGFVAMLVLTASAFESPMSLVPWWAAAPLAVGVGLALIVSGKMYAPRVIGFIVPALVFGYGITAGLQVAFQTASPSEHYLGLLFWAPYSFMVYLVIYGAGHLITQALARLHRTEKMKEDRGEPKASIAIAAYVLSAIIAILLIWQPDFLAGNAGTGNPTLALLLGTAMLAFSLWWYFPLAGLRSVLAQTIAAVGVSALAVLAINPAIWKHPDIPQVSFAAYVIGLALSYIFAFTVSAHVASEPLWKGIRTTYWNKHKGKELRVVFHNNEPHQDGRRRVLADGKLHCYPPSRSGINVSSPRLNVGHCGKTVQEVARAALDGLVGEWWATSGQKVNRVRDAVKGKIVYIKPNVVVPTGSPYTTSPELVGAVALYCLEYEAAEVHIGEIAISNITSRMSLIGTGAKDYWQSLDPRIQVHLLDEEAFTYVILENPGPPNRKETAPYEFYMCEAFTQEDKTHFYIDMPKMKTHLQSEVTLGIKNSHGLIAESERGKFHQHISQKVVDITKVWNPDLTIVDGFDALEGIGPWPGERVPLRTLVLSNDVALADMTTTQLMFREAVFPDLRADAPPRERFVKTTWLAYEQGMSGMAMRDLARTLNNQRGEIPPAPPPEMPLRSSPLWPPDPPRDTWEHHLMETRLPFTRPEWYDEQLVANIGARLGKQPDFNAVRSDDPEADFYREYLPLDNRFPIVGDDGSLQPSGNWGPAKMIADEYRYPHLGASVMLSGVFGLLKALLEKYFGRELDSLEGFAIVYGPLRKPLVCEGALLFGDGAVETDYLVFAPKIYRMAGHGKPPNCYSDTFERLADETGSKMLDFATEAVTFSRGWYW